jgi:hypothetical protein
VILAAIQEAYEIGILQPRRGSSGS